MPYRMREVLLVDEPLCEEPLAHGLVRRAVLAVEPFGAVIEDQRDVPVDQITDELRLLLETLT